MEYKFDFYTRRYMFFGIAALFLLIGLIFGFINGGLNFDIQFEGGTHLEVPMKQDNVNTGDVETYVRNTFGKAVTTQIQRLYSPDAPDNQAVHLIIKASKSETFSAEQINELQDHLDAQYGIVEDQRVSIRTVAPYIGEEMLQKGLLAILIASALILLYVWVRFSVMSGLSAAVCATATLLINAFVVLSVYAIFRLPINDLFIAAILTILGYSINDTIVVYDRVRENAKGSKRLSHVELINHSLNQSLTRSINTGLTTLLCVVTIFVFAIIFNINSLREFILPLMIGIVAGKYTTLFIVTQLWAMWQMKLNDMRLAAQQKTGKA
ncbi:MAG: protein translocase subunit SecF [Oscillospiraceae bacterium]|nr:protein translocase subunit SecF [Oscillospiraceae bacterium]